MYYQTRKEASIHFTKTVLITLADAVCMPVSSVWSLNIVCSSCWNFPVQIYLRALVFYWVFIKIGLRTSSLAKLQKQWYHSHLLGYHWLISSSWNSFCSESIFSLTCRVIITFPLSFLWRFYDLVCTPTFNFCIHVDSSHLTHEAFFFFEWNNIRVWAYFYHCPYMAD